MSRGPDVTYRAVMSAALQGLLVDSNQEAVAGPPRHLLACDSCCHRPASHWRAPRFAHSRSSHSASTVVKAAGRSAGGAVGQKGRTYS